jgi:DNA-binding PadR family transcriptional regulator
LNELVILAALLRAPAYGYALKKTAVLIFGNRALHPNIVYPLLKKFAQNGWVEQSSTPGERGQTRKQYRITAAGRNHLIQELSNFNAHAASDDGAFLFRVAFFDALPKQKSQEILAAREQFLNSRAAELAKLSEATQANSLPAIALNRVIALVRGELRWLHTLEREIESQKGNSTCQPLHMSQGTAHQS